MSETQTDELVKRLRELAEKARDAWTAYYEACRLDRSEAERLAARDEHILTMAVLDASVTPYVILTLCDAWEAKQ